MLLQVQSFAVHLPPSILPTAAPSILPTAAPSILPTAAGTTKPSVSILLRGRANSTRFLKNKPPFPRLSFQVPKCSASAVSVQDHPTPHLELTSSNSQDNPSRPFPAEVSRTIMELSSVATLSTLTTQESEGACWPLGVGVRFAVDSQGTPLLCLNASHPTFLSNTNSTTMPSPSTLHVQLDQCGLRTPQCTLLGNLEKVEDKMASKKLCSLWKKKFGEEVEEDLLYIVSVERVLHMEDFGEDGVWVTSADYKLANPDPLRDFAEKFVDEINANNMEDVYRFCNIYADLGFQVLDAKMVWVDRLGFDMRVRSTQNDVFEVRIPFHGEVTDEKGAKSSFNCMSQLAWEVEKNFQVPDFKRVEQLKKIRS